MKAKELLLEKSKEGSSEKGSSPKVKKEQPEVTPAKVAKTSPVTPVAPQPTAAEVVHAAKAPYAPAPVAAATDTAKQAMAMAKGQVLGAATAAATQPAINAVRGRIASLGAAPTASEVVALGGRQPATNAIQFANRGAAAVPAAAPAASVVSRVPGKPGLGSRLVDFIKARGGAIAGAAKKVGGLAAGGFGALQGALGGGALGTAGAIAAPAAAALGAGYLGYKAVQRLNPKMHQALLQKKLGKATSAGRVIKAQQIKAKLDQSVLKHGNRNQPAANQVITGQTASQQPIIAQQPPQTANTVVQNAQAQPLPM